MRETVSRPMKIGGHTSAVVQFFLILILFIPVLATDIAGTWTGTSLCITKDSPCHDESVIYHITKPDSEGKLKIQADKVVNGRPEDMGTLDCVFDSSNSKLTCQMKNGSWEFAVTGNKMEGTLRLPDGKLYRRISVTKEK
ncbi:MAG: hypothetical protein ABJB40_02205 [Acidobacteriota bacterium]